MTSSRSTTRLFERIRRRPRSKCGVRSTELEHARPMCFPLAVYLALASWAPGCEHGPLPNSGPPSPHSNSARLGLAAHALDRAVHNHVTHILWLFSPFLNAQSLAGVVWLQVNASSPIRAPLSQWLHSLKGYTLSKALLSQRLHSQGSTLKAPQLYQ